MFTYSRCKPEATRTQETSSGGIRVAITRMQDSLAVRKPLDTPAVGPLRSVSRVPSMRRTCALVVARHVTVRCSTTRAARGRVSRADANIDTAAWHEKPGIEKSVAL